LTSEEPKITRIVSEVRQPITIEVTRGQKGSYGWSVKVQAEDHHQALFLVETLEDELRKRYGQLSKVENKLVEYRDAPVKRSKYEEDVL
jgi:hypothetical protein